MGSPIAEYPFVNRTSPLLDREPIVVEDEVDGGGRFYLEEVELDEWNPADSWYDPSVSGKYSYCAKFCLT